MVTKPKEDPRCGIRKQWQRGPDSKKRGDKNNWSPKTKQKRRLLAKKER